MKHALGIAPGAAPSADRVVLRPAVFDDPRIEISTGVLGGGGTVGLRTSWQQREEVWIVLDGGAETRGPDGGTHRAGPGVLAGFSGSSHGIANLGADPIRYIRVAMGDRVATAEGSAEPGRERPEWSPLDVNLLGSTTAHAGRGQIRCRRLWDHDRFVSGWGFVDHAVVDPHTSVGYHRHDTVQECYLVLAGNGVMKVDDTVFEVAAGTAIPNRLGGAHGIAAGDEMVEFINVALYTEGHFDAVDLGDDLSDCR